MARSLSQFPAMASQPQPPSHLPDPCPSGRCFSLDAGLAGEPGMLWFYASGMFLLPALLPTPCHSSSCLAHGAAVTAQWIFFRVVFCQHGSCWVSVCQTCQEPVLGECWSCSSFSRACIFSCFLVTSSSLPTPGSPSGYRLPVLDGGGTLGGSSFAPPNTYCLVATSSFHKSHQWPCSPLPECFLSQAGTGKDPGQKWGADSLVAPLACRQGDVSPTLCKKPHCVAFTAL